MTIESQTKFWDDFSDRWVVEAPQAPVEEDLAWFQSQVDAARPGPGPAVILGVTPELRRIALPQGGWLVATDFSRGMIGKVWRHSAGDPEPAAVRGDWRFLPWKTATAGVVMGDGCFGVLPGLGAMGAVCGEVSRILKPGGRFLLRCFVRDPDPVSVDRLFGELLGGNVRQIGWFRWRVAMALQGAGEREVDRHRVWEEWMARIPDWEARAAQWGIPAEFVNRIRRWEGERTPLHFPTLEQVLEIASPHLEILAVDTPGYAAGPCFPRLVFGKASGPC